MNGIEKKMDDHWSAIFVVGVGNTVFYKNLKNQKLLEIYWKNELKRKYWNESRTFHL